MIQIPWFARLVSLSLLFGGAVLSAEPEKGPHVVIMIGEREYETKKTLPAFAKKELEPLGFRVTVVHADAKEPNHFPGLEALKSADLMLLSVRRRTLSADQMQLVREHFAAGRGLVAIRTASHAFSLRNKAVPDGHVQWEGFDKEVLGHTYDGHYSNKDGTDIAVVGKAEDLLKGVEKMDFKSGGTLYIARDLVPGTTVLMNGSTVEKGALKTEPVAFHRVWGESRIFYTSLGHPNDFAQTAFQRLLRNAVVWAAGDSDGN